MPSERRERRPPESPTYGSAPETPGTVDVDGDDGSLLEAQNRILSRLATGCTIPELIADVVDYIARFAPRWGAAVHLVDPGADRLTSGMSRTLDRACLREIEAIPLDALWPVRTALDSASPWRRSDEDAPSPTWSETYRRLESRYGLRCAAALPAVAPQGAVVAVVTAFRPADGGPSADELPEAALDVATSLLGVGVARLRTLERLMLAQSSIDRSREPAVCVRSDGSFLYVNDAACRAFGYSRAELLEMRAWELDAHVDRDDFERIWELTQRRGGLKLQTEVRRRDGSRIPVEIAISYATVQNEGFQCALVRNISALRDTERRLQDCEERYALAAKGANDGLWNWDLRRDTLHLSPRWCALLGLEPSERQTTPDTWWSRIHPEDLERVRAELDSHLRGDTETFESEHRMIHADGRYLWVLSRGEAVRDELGAPSRLAGSLTDISKQKLAEERLRHDARHDDLTELPNRSMFMDHLGRTLKRAQRTDTPFQFAVLFLDFDRFKRINDSLGHLVGDQLLIAIAKRLGSCVRPADTVARLGGDEFSILLEPVEDVSGATRLAERIHHSLREPFRVSGLEVFITVSIGIAIGSRDYQRPEDILRDADTAMYRAKAAGKARHEVFDDTMQARAIEQLRLESELRLAVQRNEFCLLFQPVVSLEDRRPVGVEAFARWRHPTRGLLAPASFLAVAEESGLIVDIGWWIIREACRQMKRWQDECGAEVTGSIHVNLSAKELFQPELPERIESMLAEIAVSADHLVLDVSENVIMHKAESSVTILEQLKSLGLRIHLDDFGTGYSSLGYLHRFQIDALKIDHSFIRHLRTGGENWKTVRAIVTLAENLGMDVIAEGVENAEQLHELEKLHCKHAQGSLFYDPMPSEAIEEMWRRADEAPAE